MQTSQNNEYEVTNLRCRDCKYYKSNAELDNIKSTCKRIDHKKIRFAVPWFVSYDCDYGCICSDFLPKEWLKATYNEWEQVGGFDDWWPLWVEQWLPYQNTDVYTWFTIGNNTSIEYGVKLLDYVYGRLYKSNGSLNASKKRYYKRHKISKKYPYGYELIIEDIDGVDIDGISKEHSG